MRYGPVLAQFVAGTEERPDVPRRIERCLVESDDGTWVLRAGKLARYADDGWFSPVVHDGAYPRSAIAQCVRGARHTAPQVRCTCGFYALSHEPAVTELTSRLRSPEIVRLDVELRGAVVVHAWSGWGCLFRAAQQTVVRAVRSDLATPLVAKPQPVAVPVPVPIEDDPGIHAWPDHVDPVREGPIRRPIPTDAEATGRDHVLAH